MLLRTLILSALALSACGDKDGGDGITARDGGTTDGGATDGGTTDGGQTDGGSTNDADGDGWSVEDGDCDDQDDDVYPGAPEIPWDDLDQDCDDQDAGTLAQADGDGEQDIPDLGNIEQQVEISDCAQVYGTTVAVDISHTYIGDLVVSIRTPDGTTNALHLRSGADDDDLVGTFSSELGASLDAATPLTELDGVDGTGTWTLVVYDMTQDDTGRLNSWSLELLCP